MIHKRKNILSKILDIWLILNLSICINTSILKRKLMRKKNLLVSLLRINPVKKSLLLKILKRKDRILILVSICIIKIKVNTNGLKMQIWNCFLTLTTITTLIIITKFKAKDITHKHQALIIKELSLVLLANSLNYNSHHPRHSINKKVVVGQK